jgi:hypothetical protein
VSVAYGYQRELFRLVTAACQATSCRSVAVTFIDRGQSPATPTGMLMITIDEYSLVAIPIMMLFNDTELSVGTAFTWTARPRNTLE